MRFLPVCWCVVYNQALSTTGGGNATATSSPPFDIGYEADWAIDGVLTFCNSDETACPGPHLNKMFKSLPAQTTDDVFLRIDMGKVTKTMSIYMSLEETDPTFVQPH